MQTRASGSASWRSAPGLAGRSHTGLDLSELSVRYHTLQGEIEALTGVNLTVDPGEFISLVGPSGCGKSTILSVVSGLLAPSSGKALIGGHPITGPSERVGYMLQQDYLFPWRSVLDNALLGLEVRRRRTPDETARVRMLLDRYGLAEFRDRFPRALSGGMRQRVALVRTLALDPDILLLDEPFSALDYQTRLSVGDEIGALLRQEGKSVLFVTHDIAEAISLADRVVILSKRPGQVKLDLPMKFGADLHTPLSRRRSPDFRLYFDRIWRELDHHV